MDKKSKTISYPLVALNDTQAISVNDGNIKIVGEGKKVYFNNFREN